MARIKDKVFVLSGGHSDTLLEPQHLGSRGRGSGSLRPARAKNELQAKVNKNETKQTNKQVLIASLKGQTMDTVK